eukprot:gene22733-29897_t
MSTPGSLIIALACLLVSGHGVGGSATSVVAPRDGHGLESKLRGSSHAHRHRASTAIRSSRKLLDTDYYDYSWLEAYDYEFDWDFLPNAIDGVPQSWGRYDSWHAIDIGEVQFSPGHVGVMSDLKVGCTALALDAHSWRIEPVAIFSQFQSLAIDFDRLSICETGHPVM